MMATVEDQDCSNCIECRHSIGTDMAWHVLPPFMVGLDRKYRTWILTFGIKLENWKILWTCTKLFLVAPTSHYTPNRTWILTIGKELEIGKILWTCTKLFSVAPTSHYTPNRTWILTIGKELESGKILWSCTKLFLDDPTWLLRYILPF